MNAITEAIARGWEDFTARPSGSLSFRFIIQPVLAGVIAIRAGLKDAKAGRPPFLQEMFSHSGHRKEVLRGGLKDVRLPFYIAVTLDAVYQTFTHRAIYLFELFFTATLLAVVPYFILRGLVNRVARLFFHGKRATGTTDHDSQT
jgi:hypothetical protein